MSDPVRPTVVLYQDRLPAHPVPTGWRGRAGFALPGSPWDLSDRRWMCTGSIDGSEDAGRAIEALTRGVGLAVTLRVQGDLRHRTLEDLHRLADVRTADLDAAHDDLASVLDPDQLALLRALAAGRTVGAAASAIHLSRRTANRRLADLRLRLGVETNAEAISRLVAQHRSDGVGPPGPTAVAGGCPPEMSDRSPHPPSPP